MGQGGGFREEHLLNRYLLSKSLTSPCHSEAALYPQRSVGMRLNSPSGNTPILQSCCCRWVQFWKFYNGSLSGSHRVRARVERDSNTIKKLQKKFSSACIKKKSSVLCCLFSVIKILKCNTELEVLDF